MKTETQVNPVSHSERQRELTRIMQAIFIGVTTCAPAFRELLLWVPYRYPEHQIGNYIAYATQTEMFFQNRFFDLTIKEQVGVVLHEMWHVALRHVWLTKQFHAHPYIANIAQDVLINEGLLETRKYRHTGVDRRPWFDLPAERLDVEWLENYLQTRLQKPWYKYDWYELYQFILENAPAPKDGEPSLYVDGSYYKDAKGREIKIPRGFEKDLIESPAAKNSDGEEMTEEMQENLWSSRIKNVLAGDTTGKIAKYFQGLLPKVKEIPWDQLYRRYLLNWAIRHELDVTYQRLHRRYLSGVVPYIVPSVQRQRGLLPVTVIFDTSLSISEDILLKFAKHTDEFRTKFDLELEMWVIMADCGVKECTRLESGRTLESYLKNQKIRFAGRGGTSFVPALQKASELRTKLCIYFTDLYGDCGKSPKGMDVLWVVVNNDAAQPNFGKVIRIKD